MEIRLITWKEALDIRHEVLWPSKDPLFCKVDGDETGTHYGGFVNNRLISVASVYIDGSSARLRKFATIQKFQKNGYGTLIIKHIMLELKANDIISFWCDARTSATDFYRRFGMNTYGNEFDKFGVKYIKMKVQLY